MNTSETAVTLIRSIAAPVRQVYAAWTQTELMRRWLAPAPYEVQSLEAEVRVGGRYRIAVATGPGEVPHVTTGVYRELVANRRLVQTWRYEGPHPAAEHAETLLTVDFLEPEPGVTRLTLRHENVTSPEGREALRQGWNACLDKLQSISGLGHFPDGQTLRLERLLAGPLERVWEQLTQADSLAAWLAKARIEARLGAHLRLDMTPREGALAENKPVIILGVVTRCEPLRAFAFTWRNDPPIEDAPETMVSFELSLVGERVRLVLTHSRVPREWLARTAGGWHGLLDDFQARLEGREPPAFMATFRAVLAEYERLVAAS